MFVRKIVAPILAASMTLGWFAFAMPSLDQVPLFMQRLNQSQRLYAKVVYDPTYTISGCFIQDPTRPGSPNCFENKSVPWIVLAPGQIPDTAGLDAFQATGR